MSAPPDTDRSLNANQPVTEPIAPVAGTNAAPDSVLPPSARPEARAGDTSPSPDLSGLTREQLEARVKMLTDNLSLANADSEFFRQQWQDLRLRDEALGVDALTVDERKQEEKIVQAVKELYQSEMRRRESLQVMDKLLTTTEKLLQTAPHYDPQVRADYEVASRSAKEYLAGRTGAAIPIGTSLSEGQIADLNPGLNAVILNLGKTQGVKEGMPFLIFQNNAQVATAKVVMARDQVSAALVQNLQPNIVLKVGDRVAVDAQR